MQVTAYIAFSYGLLSFLSPCILPLIPVYLGSLVGPELFFDKQERRRLPVLLHALSFVAGFTIVFTLWGAGSGLLGGFLLERLSLFRRISGIVLVIFGLVMLAALKIPWFNYENRLGVSLPSRISYLRSFITGAVFPIAWIPCTSWALGGILLLAGNSQTVWQGAGLLAVYSIGLGLPFLIAAVAFDYVLPLMKSIQRYSSWIYVVSGVLLIAMGVLVLTDNITWLLGVV